MAEPLRVAVGLALGLFAPGFALLALLRPWKPATVMEWAERLFLSVLLSLALLVAVSVPLVYGPWRLDGRGPFQGGASGAPVLEALLGGLTALFAVGAWLRARAVPPLPPAPADEVDQHRRADAVERGEGSAEDLARDLHG